MSIWRFLKACLFGLPSFESVVDAWFSKESKDEALRFYSSWREKKYLSVTVGGPSEDSSDPDDDPLDLGHLFSSDQFFRTANFYFFNPPRDIGDAILIGNEWEEDCSSILLDKETGSIVLFDEGGRNMLASNFHEFLAKLLENGWKPEVSW